MQLLNTAILKQPTNWLTVLLMVFIGGIVLHLVLSHYRDVSDTEN